MSVVNTRGAVFSIGRRCCVWSGAKGNTSDTSGCGGVVLCCLLEKIDSDLNLKVDRVGISSTEQPLLCKTLRGTLTNWFQFYHFKIRNNHSVH